MTRFFCTYFDWNYRQKGLALWESLERHCRDYHLWILALDESTERLLSRLSLPNVSVIAMSSFETDALRAVKPSRSTREYYWTCTASWILFVLRTSPVDHITYFDADCYLFGGLEPVFQEFDGRSLAITPHDFPQRLQSFISNGVYNVGMVYVKKDDTGLACMEEWEALCLNWCYLRHEPPHPDWFCDQKYWDKLAPKYDVHSIQHKGANRAPWNMEKYGYSIRGNKVFVDDQPLLWWHYHGYEGKHKMYPETYVSSRLQRKHVYAPYVEALRRADERIRSVS